MSSENNIDHSHSLHHRQHHLHHRQRRRGRMRQQQQPKQQIQRRISVGVGRRQCQSVNRLMATRSIGRVRLRTALLWLALSVIIVVQTLSTNSIPSLQWHHSSGHAHRQHQAAVTGAHLDTIHTNNATKISPEDDRGDHHHHHHEQLLDSTSQSKQAPAWQRISVAAADELLGSAQPEDQQQQDGAFMEQSNELTTANNNGPIGERPESSQRIVAVSRASSLEGAGLDSSETVPSDEGEEENKKRRKNSDLTRAQDDGREDDDDGDEAVDKEETLGDAYVSGDLLHGPARTSKSIAHEPVVARAAKRPRAKTTTTQADAMGGGNTNELGESPVQDEEEEAEAGDGEEGADNGGAEQDEEEAADELEAQEDEEEATATATTKEQLRPGAGDEEDDEQDEPEELAESEEPSAASKDGRENELELPAGGYQTTGSVTRPELDLDVPVSRRMMTTTSMTTTTRKTQQRPSWLSSPASSSLGARRQPPAELATRISLSSSSSSSSSSAAAVASRLDGGAAQIVDSKAAQWRKLKRLNRKIAASTATTTTSTTITTTTTISPPSVEEQTDHHHQDRTPKSRELGSQTDESGGGVGVGERQFRPRLAQFYLGRIKENERLVSVTPKLRVENGAEICDFELRPLTASSSEASSTIAASNRQAGGSKTSALDEQPAEEDPRQLPFFVSWIDRIQGEVTIEANDLTQINCERQQNYTMRARAIGCNGLESNEALLRIELEDVNEFRPEFERAHYSVSVDVARVLAAATTNRLLRTTKTTGGSRREQAGQMSRDQVDNTNTEHSDTNWDNNRNQHRNQDVEEEDEEETKWAGLGNNNELGVSRGSPFSGAPDAWCHLLTVRAHDQDCSREFGEICRYELAEQTAGSGLASITETSSSSSGAGDQEQVSRGDQQGNAGSAGSGTSAHIRIDSRGNLRADCGWLWNQAQSRNQQNASVGAQQQQAPPPTAHTLTLQVVAFDCGGRKSRAPATVHVELLAQSRRETSSISNQHQASQQTTAPNGAAHCEPGWKDVDTQIAYGPSSGERWPFQQARLELCSVKCHRPNITVKLQLEATPTTLGDRAGRARPSSLAAVGARQQNGNGATRMPAPPSSYATTGGHSAAAPVFHCDRDPYAMVSKRRLCGARRKTIELLPPLDRHTSWTGSLFVGNSHHNRRDRNQNDLGGPEASQGAPRWPWTEAGQPEDLDMDSGALMQDGTDNESAGHQRITTSSRPTAANDDEENLGAYLPDGSYGRLASEFAARNRKGSPLAHSTGSTTTTTMKLGETRAGRGHAGSSQQEAHHEAAVSSRSGRVGEPTAGPAGGSSSMGGGASSARGGVVYRDQVYHFDGIDDALVVPSSIYTSSSSSQLDSQQTANEDSSGGNLLFGTRHTISFWMRHSEFKFKFERRQRRTNDSYGPMETNGSDARGENQDVDVDVDVNDDEDQLAKLSRHVQEHVLCVSERLASRRTSSNGSSSQATFGHSLDEHHHRDSHHHHHQNHYAIYLKNCKLNLLIRNGQQPRNTAGGGNREPVEWRWSLDERGGQFCDNKWHLYTLNVNYPSQVELFVDGQQFNNEKRLTTSSSEWSHTTTTTTKSSQMALAVGACYEARTRSMVGHFRGSLSGLSLVMNTNDDTSSIECLGRCTESLVSMAPQNDQQQLQEQQPLLQLQESRQDNSLVAYQESQDRIQLQGHDLVDIEEALAQIAYVNRRQLPSVGRRTIELTTQLSCQQQSGIGEPAAAPSTQLAIEPLAIRIDVLPSTSLPAISLTGTPNLAREHLPFIQGRVAPFESLSLQVKQLNLLGASDNGGSSSSWEHAAAQGRTKRPLSWAKNSNHHHQRSHHHHNHHHHHHQRTSNRGGGDEAAPSDLLDYIDDATASARAAAAAAVATGNTMASVASSGGANDSRPPPTPTRWTDSMGINLEASENLAAARRRIEACHVQVIGTGSELASQLDESNESLVLPIEQLTKLALYWRQSKWGALIYGLDTAENYETLLRLILYKNLRPDLTSERLFRLTCSDMSGRLLSNEYVQRLTMIHPGPSLSSSLQETGPSMDNGGAFAADQSAAFMNASSQLIVLSGPADDRRYDSLRSQQTRPERILLEPTDEQLGSRSITGEPMDDSMATVATASQRQQQLQLDSKFNTIAVAIMVLLVSAVLIILVIALANMKGANEYDEYSRHERRVRRRARREARLARRARRQQTSGMIRRRRQQTSSSCLSIDEDLGGSDCDEQQQQRELQQREPVLHLSSRIRNDELLVNNGACSYGGCDNDHAAADADSLRGSISSSASDEDYEDDDDDGLTSGASSDSCDDTTPQPKAVSEYNYQPAARRQAGATIPLGRLARAPIQSHNCRGGGNCVSRHHEGDTITAQSSIEMDSLSWDDEIRRTGTGTEVATRAARRTRARDRAADHHQRTAGARGDGNTIVVMNPILHGDSDTATKLNSTTSVYQFKNGKRPLMASIRRPNASERPQSHLIQVLDLAQTRAHAADDDEEEEATRASRGPLERTSKTMLIDELIPMDESFCDSRSRSCSGSSNGDEEDEDDDEEDELSRSCSELSDDGLDREGLRGRSSPGSHLAWFDSEVDHEDQLEQQQHNRHLHNHHHHHHLMQQQARCNGRQHLLAGGRQHEPDCPVIRGAGCCDEGRTDDGGETTATELEDIDELEEAKTGNRCSTSTRGKLDTTISYEVYHDHHHQCLRAQRGRQQSTHQQRQQEQKLNITTTTDRLTG